MIQIKEQLAQLIEAYAAARATGIATLQQFATQQLSTFLDAVDVTAKEATADESDGGQE
jgi:hypothetical protein